MEYRFTYDLTADPDGGFTIAFAAFPEAIAHAADRDAVPAIAADCLEEAIAGRIDDREDIPTPSLRARRGKAGGLSGQAAPGALIAAKAALYQALRADAMAPHALARRLGVADTEVRRMLDPRHATKIGRLESALAALGKRLVVSLEDRGA